MRITRSLGRSVALSTRSKNFRLHTPLYQVRRKKRKQSPLFVAATHIRNYLIKDTLVDWLKYVKFKGKKVKEISGFNEYIIQKGVEFEDKLVQYIHDNILPVEKVCDKFDEKKVRKTKELMKKGVPIIHSAPVKTKDNTGGLIDLLVRSDYLGMLISKSPLTEVYETIPAPKLNGNYHYVVLDIKFSTLPLRADGIHLLNSGSYPAYKGQIRIYTEAVGEIQGYTPRFGFVLGRRWRYTSKGITYKELSCLDRVGVIDYESVDMEYVSKTENAIKWVREVRKNGKKWSVDPPSRKELYPNMCIDSGNWNNEKEKIANNIADITKLWYCGTKHRDIALKNGITRWDDDECNSITIGQKGTRAPTIDKIIKINKQDDIKIVPDVIKSNIFTWKIPKDNELFVDFETLSDIFAGFDSLPRQPATDMIFMIGVTWVNEGVVTYRSFICNSPTFEEEYRIMDEFANFVYSMGNPPLYFWHAERMFWDKAECRQFDRFNQNDHENIVDHISDDWNIGNWCDLATLFRTEPIVVKGAFGFGLKEIASAMRKHGMITSRIESECHSGMDAMVYAWKCYNENPNPATCDIMKDIEKYNRFDCTVLYEILKYLRENHS